MQINQSIERIIEDLFTLMNIYNSNADKSKSEELIVLYLSANYGFIEYCLVTLYSHTTEEQRRDYAKGRRECDESAVYDDFKGVSLSAINIAKEYWRGSVFVNADWQDELNMLTRGLHIAKFHIPNSIQPEKIFLHPIKAHTDLGSYLKTG